MPDTALARLLALLDLEKIEENVFVVCLDEESGQTDVGFGDLHSAGNSECNHLGLFYCYREC